MVVDTTLHGWVEVLQHKEKQVTVHVALALLSDPKVIVLISCAKVQWADKILYRFTQKRALLQLLVREYYKNNLLTFAAISITFSVTNFFRMLLTSGLIGQEKNFLPMASHLPAFKLPILVCTDMHFKCINSKLNVSIR